MGGCAGTGRPVVAGRGGPRRGRGAGRDGCGREAVAHRRQRRPPASREGFPVGFRAAEPRMVRPHASPCGWPTASTNRRSHSCATVSHCPPASPSEMRRRQEWAHWPILHGFSTALVPRPAGWRPGLEVVGNWWPHHDASERLPTDVEDFLGAGPRPVLIGFGSMASGDGERLSEIAVRALRRAGLRGILQAGSAGLAADGDDVLTIGDVPHALLFSTAGCRGPPRRGRHLGRRAACRSARGPRAGDRRPAVLGGATRRPRRRHRPDSLPVPHRRTACRFTRPSSEAAGTQPSRRESGAIWWPRTERVRHARPSGG
ncbi:hypothetical protein SUDANB178_06412 [Streptomyces sp. enrichment culture]